MGLRDWLTRRQGTNQEQAPATGYDLGDGYGRLASASDGEIAQIMERDLAAFNSYEWLGKDHGVVVPHQGKTIVDQAGRPFASTDKNLAYQDYAAWQNLDENGSFFGPEFSIRATAPRIKALFVNEPWVYVTATLIARTLASIPLYVYQTGTDRQLPQHPLSTMLNSGSIYQSGRHQSWSGYLDLVLGGNFFQVVDQFYMSLTLAPVELVSINLGDVSNPGPTSITVANPSKMGTRYLVPYNRVVHLRLPNPNNPFYGLSPFAAASRPMLLDRYKNEFEMAFYLRGATNQGVIETTQDISKQRFERLMRSFEQAYTGKRNWWRTLFLPKGATWKSSSPTMKDMEHLDGLKENRLTILSVLGIPPSMVGLTEDVNYSTSEAQMQIFYDSTILPMMSFIEDGYNNSALVREQYRGQVEVRADTSKIKAMRDKGELAVKGDIAGKIARFFTINEIRDRIFQAPPIQGGDVFAISPGASSEGKNPDNAVQGLAGSAGPYAIHVLAFGKDLYKTPQDCSTWARAHGYTAEPVTETGTTWKIIQRPIDEFDAQSLHAVELPDSVTAMFGQIRGNNDSQASSGGEPTQPSGDTPTQLPAKGRITSEVKQLHAATMTGIERSYGAAYIDVYKRYINNLFTLVDRAVASRQDIRKYLKTFEDEVARAYMTDVMELLSRVAQRGYALNKANTKGLNAHTVTKSGEYRFTAADSQAIDVLEARGKKDRDEILEDAVIDRFYKFNETRTEQIMSVVEAGYNDGKTLEEIAAFVRQTYGENYQDQAYTIARTEVLSALSAGVKAHNDDLQEIFSEVDKEWVTVGDDRVRDEHTEFEELGPVSANYEYAPGLVVPRDYGAEAGLVINCRCSLVNSIPSSATSRASAILDSDTP